jgi:hypothetical protein
MSFILLGKEYLQGIEDLAFEFLIDFEDRAVKSLIDNKGLTYGDVELNPMQRMMKFIDDEQRGVNSNLSPEERIRRSREFITDTEQTGTV